MEGNSKFFPCLSVIIRLWFVYITEISRMPNTDKSSLEMLNAENYMYWSQRMTGLMLGKGSLSAVQHEMPLVPTVEESQKNEKAMSILMTSIDKYSLEYIKNCVTAKAMWDRLKATRGTFQLWCAIQAFRELCHARKEPEQDVEAYWAKMNELLFKIRGGGIELSDQLAAIVIAIGLPPSYDTFVRAIKFNDKIFDILAFKAELLEEETKAKVKDDAQLEDNYAMLMHREMRLSKEVIEDTVNIDLTLSVANLL